MDINYRGEGQLPGRSNFAPGQEPIRRVEAQAAALIRLYHSIRIISNKLVEVVQVPIGPGANVGSIQGAAVNSIPSRDLEFLVKITPAVGQRKNAGRRNGVKKELAHRVSLLICNS